jgi:hypothetical protein
VAGVSTLISAVTPFTKDVVLIGDPPDQGQQPVDCLLDHDATLGTCTKTLSGDQISVYKQPPEPRTTAARRSSTPSIGSASRACAR